MKFINQVSQQKSDVTNETRAYEMPAVIYVGTITTRAGSPLGKPDGEGIDPADLFSSD